MPTVPALRRLAAAAAFVVPFVAASPAGAASYLFASTAPLLLGGRVSGSFSGVDGNADSFLEASELSGFSVAYTGAPPATASFGIAKRSLDGGDGFFFDLASGTFAFQVFDGAGRSIGGGTDQSTSVVGSGSDVDAGGTLAVSAVPEPASAALTVFGVLAVWGRVAMNRRRSPVAAAFDR